MKLCNQKAQILSTRGSLKTIQTQINDTSIRAPFNGIVTRKFADPGAFVTPTTAGSAVSSATSSLILSLASKNQIVANVAESNIAQMRLGQKATIKADAFPLYTFEGKVVQISPGISIAVGASTLMKIPLIISPLSILAGFGISAGVGLVAVVVPASNAAKLDPIVALRSD